MSHSKVLLISYDNGSHIPFFPINLAYIMRALKSKGHAVGVWSQDIHHGSEDVLTSILDNQPFDIVGLGFCAGYYQFEKAIKIAKAIKASKRRNLFNFVLGGHGPAGAPEYFMDILGANTVIVGDGEKAVLDITRDHRGIIQGEPCDVEISPVPIYEDFGETLNVYRLIRWPTSNRTDFCFPILSSRGCKWNCSFCYRMREGFNERSIESIIEEIVWLKKQIQITHFQFADELLMSSEKRTEEICEAILALPWKIKWDCNGRLNYATSPQLMGLMKKSGCNYINYGIESLNQEILNQMKKGLTVEKIHQGVEATLKAGLSPGLNLLWGFPKNSEQDLKEEVKFLKQFDPGDELRTIRPVTPYPGCQLYQEGIEKGLIKDAKDFYENLHKNSDLLAVNFMDIPTQDAHRMLYEANKELVENYMSKRTTGMIGAAEAMYLRGEPFRGFRAV